MKLVNLVFSLCLTLVSAMSFAAADDVRKFDNKAQEKLFLELADELRCPKCQNQNIADSNANVAKDLRAKVHKLVLEGKSKDEVVDYMVERYGYFVYYKPPVNAATLVLWLLPIAFMVFTLLLIWYKSKRSGTEQFAGEWDEAKEQQLNELIARIEAGQLGAETNRSGGAQ